MTGIVIDIEAKVDKAQGSIDALARSLAKISQNTNNIEKALTEGSLSKEIGKKPTESISKLNKESSNFKDTLTKTDKTFTGSFLNKSSDLKVNKSLDKTGDSLRSINDLAVGLAGNLKAAFGAVAFGGAFAGLTKVSSDFQDLENQIANVVGRSEQLAATMLSLNDVALRTRTLYASTTTVFTGFGRAMKDTRVSMETLLGVTETIQKAVAVSGASTDSANAALFQLNQGLSAGALRGEELNSVMEQTPRIAKAIADNLDVSLGKLRELASTGQVTTAVVMKALLDQAKQINKEFAVMKPTMAQGVSKLGEMIKSIASEFEKGLGLSDFFGEFLSDAIHALSEVSKNAFEMGVNFGRVITNIKERMKDFAEPIIFGFEKIVLKVKLLLGALGISTFVKKEIGEAKYIFDAYIKTAVRSYEAYGAVLRTLGKRGVGKGIWSVDDSPMIITAFKNTFLVYKSQLSVLGSRMLSSGRVLKENLKSVFAMLPQMLGEVLIAKKTGYLLKTYMSDILDFRAEIPRVIGRMGVYLFDALSSMFSRIAKGLVVSDLFSSFIARSSDNRKVAKILNDIFYFIASKLSEGFNYLSDKTKELTDWSFLDYITNRSQTITGRLRDSFASLFQMKGPSLSFRKVFNIVVIQLDEFYNKSIIVFDKIQKAFNKFGVTTKFAKMFSGVTQDTNKALAGIKSYFRSLQNELVIKFESDTFAKNIGKVFKSLQGTGTILKVLAKTLYQAFVTIKSTLSSINEAFDTAGVYNRLLQGLRFIEKLFGNFIKGIRGKLKDLESSTNISFSAKDLAKSINKLFDGIENQTNKLEKAFGAISKFGENVIEVFFKIYDAVIGNSWWTDTIDSIISTVRSLKNNTDGGLKQFAGNTIRVFQAIYEVVISIFKRISTVDISSNLQKMLEAVKTISPMAANVLSSIGDGVVSSFRKIRSIVADTLRSDFVISISTGNFRKSIEIAKDFAKNLFDGLPEELKHSLTAFANVFGLAFVSLLLPENRITSMLGGLFLRAAIAAGLAFANVFADVRFGVSFSVEAGKVAGKVAGTVLLGILADLPAIISNLLGFIGGAVEGFLKSIPIVGTVASMVYGILDLFQFSTAGGLIGALLFGGPALKMLSTLGIFEKQISRIFKVTGSIGSFFGGTMANTAVAGHNMTRLMTNPAHVGMGPPLPPGVGYQSRPQTAMSRASSSFFSSGNVVSSSAMVALVADQLGMFDQVFYDSPLGHAYMQGGLIALALMGPSGIDAIRSKIIYPVMRELSMLFPEGTIRGNLVRMFGMLGSMVRDPSILANLFAGMRERFASAFTGTGTGTFFSRLLFGPTGIPATSLGAFYNSIESAYNYATTRFAAVSPLLASAFGHPIVKWIMLAVAALGALTFSNMSSADTMTPSLNGETFYRGIQEAPQGPPTDLINKPRAETVKPYHRIPVPSFREMTGRGTGHTVLQKIADEVGYGYDRLSLSITNGLKNLIQNISDILPTSLKGMWDSLTPSQVAIGGIALLAGALTALYKPLINLQLALSPITLFRAALAALGNQLLAFQGIAATSGLKSVGLNMKSYTGLYVSALWDTMRQASPILDKLASKIGGSSIVKNLGANISKYSSELKQGMSDRTMAEAVAADLRNRKRTYKEERTSRFDRFRSAFEPNPSKGPETKGQTAVRGFARFLQESSAPITSGAGTVLQQGFQKFPNLTKVFDTVKEKGEILARTSPDKFVPRLKLYTAELYAMARATAILRETMGGKFVSLWLAEVAGAMGGLTGLTNRITLMTKALALMVNTLKFISTWRAAIVSVGAAVLFRIPFLESTDEFKKAGERGRKAFMGSFELGGSHVDVAATLFGGLIPAIAAGVVGVQRSRFNAAKELANNVLDTKISQGLTPANVDRSLYTSNAAIKKQLLQKDLEAQYAGMTPADRRKDFNRMGSYGGLPMNQASYMQYYMANPNRALLGAKGALTKGIAGAGATATTLVAAGAAGAYVGNKIGGETGAGIGAGLAMMFSSMVIPKITSFFITIAKFIPRLFLGFNIFALTGGILAMYLMGSNGTLMGALDDIYEKVKKILGIHSAAKDKKTGLLKSEADTATQYGISLKYDARLIDESNIEDPQIFERYTKAQETFKSSMEALKNAEDKGGSGDKSALQKDAEKAAEVLNKKAAEAMRASRFNMQKTVDLFKNFTVERSTRLDEVFGGADSLSLPTRKGSKASGTISAREMTMSTAYLTPEQDAVKARIFELKAMADEAVKLGELPGLDENFKMSLAVASNDVYKYTTKINEDLSSMSMQNLLGSPDLKVDISYFEKSVDALGKFVSRAKEIAKALADEQIYTNLVSSLVGNLKDANVSITANDILPESENNAAISRLQQLGLEAKRLKDHLDHTFSTKDRNATLSTLRAVEREAKLAQEMAADTATIGPVALAKNIEKLGIRGVEALRFVNEKATLDIKQATYGQMMTTSPERISRALVGNDLRTNVQRGVQSPPRDLNIKEVNAPEQVPFKSVNPAFIKTPSIYDIPALNMLGAPNKFSLLPKATTRDLSSFLPPALKEPLIIPIDDKVTAESLNRFALKVVAARANIEATLTKPEDKPNPFLKDTAEWIKVERENATAADNYNKRLEERKYDLENIDLWMVQLAADTKRFQDTDPFAKALQGLKDIETSGINYQQVFKDFGRADADKAATNIARLKNAIQDLRDGKYKIAGGDPQGLINNYEDELARAEAAIAHREIQFPEFGLDAPRKFRAVSVDLLKEIDSVDKQIFNLNSDIKLAGNDTGKIKTLSIELAKAEKRREEIKAGFADLTSKTSTVNEVFGSNMSTALMAGLPSKLWAQLSGTATQYKTALEEAMKESDMTSSTEALATSFENLKSHTSFLGFFVDMKTRLKETITDGFTSSFEKIKSGLPDLNINASQYAALPTTQKVELKNRADTIYFAEALQKMDSMSGEMYNFATDKLKGGMPIKDILSGMESRFGKEFANLNIAGKLTPPQSFSEMLLTAGADIKSGASEFRGAVTDLIAGKPATGGTAESPQTAIPQSELAPMPKASSMAVPEGFSAKELNNSTYDAIFKEAATKYNVDWIALKALGIVESRLKKDAVSDKGAIGVMQLVPRWHKLNDYTDARENIFAGAKYYKSGLKRNNEDLAMTAGGYNVGFGNSYNNTETQNQISRFRDVYGYLKGAPVADTSAPVTKVDGTLNTVALKANTVKDEMASAFQLWIETYKIAANNQETLNTANADLVKAGGALGRETQKTLITEAGFTEDAFLGMNTELKNYALTVAGKINQLKADIDAAIKAGKPTEQFLQDRLNASAGVEGTNKGLAANTMPTTLKEMDAFRKASTGNITAFLREYSGLSAENIDLMTEEDKVKTGILVHQQADLEYQMAVDAKAGKSTVDTAGKILSLGDDIKDMGDKSEVAAASIRAARDAGKAFSSTLTTGFTDAFKGLLRGEKDSGQNAFQTFASKLKQNLIDSTINSFSTGVTNSLGFGKGGAVENMASGLGEGIFKMFDKGINSIPGVTTASAATSNFSKSVGSFFKNDVGNFFGFAEGGPIVGPGTGTSDSIMAKLSNGEFVINAKSTAKYGNLINAINNDKLPKFALGGMVNKIANAETRSPLFSNIPVLEKPTQTNVTIDTEILDTSAFKLNKSATDLSDSAAKGSSLWDKLAAAAGGSTPVTSLTGVGVDVGKQVLKFFSDTGKWAWNGLIDVGSKVGTFFSDSAKWAWNGIVDVSTAIGDFISKNAKWAWNGIVDVGSKVEDFFSDTTKWAWSGLVDVSTKVGAFFANAGKWAWNGLIDVSTKVGAFFTDSAKWAWNSLIDVGSKVGTFFADARKWAWTNLVDVGSKVGDFFSDTTKWAWDGIVDVGKKVGTFFADTGKWAWSGIIDVGKKVGDFFLDTTKWAWSGIIDVGAALGDSISKNAKLVWDGVIDVGKKVGDFFTDTTKWVWTGIVDVGKKVGNFFTDTTKWAWDGIIDVGKKVGNFFTDTTKWAWTGIVDVGAKVGGFFTDNAKWAWNTAVDISASIGTWVTTNAATLWKGTVNLGADIGKGITWAWTSAIDLADSAKTWIETAANNFWKGSIDLGTKAGDWIGTTTSKFWTGTVALGTKVGDWIGTSANNFWGGTVALGTKAGDWITTKASDFWTGTVAVGTKIGDWIDTTSSKFWTGTVDIGTKLGSWISTNASTLFTNAGQVLTDTGATLAETGKVAWSGIVDISSSLTAWLKETANITWSGIADVSSSIGTWIGTAGNWTWTKAVDVSKSVTDWLGTAANITWSGLADISTSLSAWFTTKAGSFITGTLDVGSQVVNTVGSTLAETGKIAWSGIVDISANLKTWLGTASNIVWSGAAEIGESLKTYLSKAGNWVWNTGADISVSVGTYLKTAGNWLWSTAVDIGDSVSKAVPTIAKWAWTSTVDISKSVTSWLGTAANITWSGIADISSSLGSWFTTKAGSFITGTLDVGKQVVSSTAAVISDTSKIIWNGTADIGTSLKTYLSKAANWTWTTATDLGAGITAFIDKSANWAWAKAIDVGANIKAFLAKGANWVWTNAVDIGTALTSFVTTKGNWLWSTATDLSATVGSKIKDLATFTWGGVVDMGTTVGDSLTQWFRDFEMPAFEPSSWVNQAKVVGGAVWDWVAAGFKSLDKLDFSKFISSIFKTGGVTGTPNADAKIGGGIFQGSGTGTSDSNVIRISNGEYIIPAKQTAEYADVLNQIRAGTFGKGMPEGVNLGDYAKGIETGKYSTTSNKGFFDAIGKLKTYDAAGNPTGHYWKSEYAPIMDSLGSAFTSGLPSNSSVAYNGKSYNIAAFNKLMMKGISGAGQLVRTALGKYSWDNTGEMSDWTPDISETPIAGTSQYTMEQLRYTFGKQGEAIGYSDIKPTDMTTKFILSDNGARQVPNLLNDDSNWFGTGILLPNDPSMSVEDMAAIRAHNYLNLRRFDSIADKQTGKGLLRVFNQNPKTKAFEPAKGSLGPWRTQSEVNKLIENSGYLGNTQFFDNTTVAQMDAVREASFPVISAYNEESQNTLKKFKPNLGTLGIFAGTGASSLFNLNDSIDGYVWPAGMNNATALAKIGLQNKQYSELLAKSENPLADAAVFWQNTKGSTHYEKELAKTSSVSGHSSINYWEDYFGQKALDLINTYHPDASNNYLGTAVQPKPNAQVQKILEATEKAFELPLKADGSPYSDDDIKAIHQGLVDSNILSKVVAGSTKSAVGLNGFQIPSNVMASLLKDGQLGTGSWALEKNSGMYNYTEEAVANGTKMRETVLGLTSAAGDLVTERIPTDKPMLELNKAGKWELPKIKVSEDTTNRLTAKLISNVATGKSKVSDWMQPKTSDLVDYSKAVKIDLSKFGTNKPNTSIMDTITKNLTPAGIKKFGTDGSQLIADLASKIYKSGVDVAITMQDYYKSLTADGYAQSIAVNSIPDVMAALPNIPVNSFPFGVDELAGDFSSSIGKQFTLKNLTNQPLNTGYFPNDSKIGLSDFDAKMAQSQLNNLMQYVRSGKPMTEAQRLGAEWVLQQNGQDFNKLAPPSMFDKALNWIIPNAGANADVPPVLNFLTSPSKDVLSKFYPKVFSDPVVSNKIIDDLAPDNVLDSTTTSALLENIDFSSLAKSLNGKLVSDWGKDMIAPMLSGVEVLDQSTYPNPEFGIWDRMLSWVGLSDKPEILTAEQHDDYETFKGYKPLAISKPVTPSLFNFGNDPITKVPMLSIGSGKLLKDWEADENPLITLAKDSQGQGLSSNWDAGWKNDFGFSDNQMTDITPMVEAIFSAFTNDPVGTIASIVTPAAQQTVTSLLTGWLFSSVMGMATGGLVKGPGTGTSDSIPTMLSNGEFVINAASTARNRQLLEAINSGATISSAASPIMAVPTASKANSTTNTITNNSVINMNITGDISRQTRAEISQMLPQIAAGVNQYNRERNYRG
jgi:tape measure domain-containing protein